MLTQQALIESFRRIGIQQGKPIVVHSSLRSLGPVDGGADTVLDALLAYLGKDGLLIMPTFTYDNPGFDPDKSKSLTGALTEVFRKRSPSVRSLHPTHSVAASGKEAARICEGHHQVPGLGIDSPLDRAAKEGGGVLLIGVGHTSNSTIHVGESYARLPFLHVPFTPNWPNPIQIAGQGRGQLEVYLDEHPGCSRAFGTVEAPLRQRGSIKDGLIGKALAQWMPGQAVIDVTLDLLQKDKNALLCTDSNCYRCSRSRAILHQEKKKN
ncbi:AAC(3) family N-acetyltransferase [Paenibacillus roseipurpureus]|uniref:Aminoglycoside N(3)-acetyltransferase n=1 Tax=Paenibacillus roseopurpureus TaxID=2918901 RepID=A0AA96RMM1_9BACL|nr:AAC(3) family N-acetyltransferase [Paenibacillus sp. MBLB1832]WNR46835.1 AAC(3) family N-acetyltransferase [Paenibacillus sp. MBLB1832]